MPASTVSGRALPTWRDVAKAAERIEPLVVHTPILQSSLLNQWLGHEIYFKAECLQTVGAFKARGACNAIAELCERDGAPRCIVANSSGNHAQAVAWAARRFGLPAHIYMPANVSPIKLAATREYGAKTMLYPTRAEADSEVAQAALGPGVEWIHPFNRLEVIAGQGTAAWEALQELGQVDGVCAPCGGGGLLSGSLLAARHLCPAAQVMGAEPLLANDAARSRHEGQIVRLEHTPDTMADGARTLSVGDLTFDFIRQADAFYEITETEIAYWTQWLSHLLKLHLEPTSALAMAGALRWLSTADKPKKVLVILSGGNVSSDMMRTVYRDDHLQRHPALQG